MTPLKQGDKQKKVYRYWNNNLKYMGWFGVVFGGYVLATAFLMPDRIATFALLICGGWMVGLGMGYLFAYYKTTIEL